MRYNQLGKSDLHISEIGFGCMSLGEERTESVRILQQAFGQGINYFDTADLYQQGRNEEMLGQAFRGKRDQVILATKVGNQMRTDGTGWDWNPSGKYIKEAVEHSLKRLQTDYIDLYQLHGGTIDDPIEEVIETFESLRQQGKIRYYGISSIRPNVIREYVKRSGIVSVMMQYSLLDRRPEEEMLRLLKEHEIGVLARGSVAKGLLIDKKAATYLNYSAEEVQKAADAVQQVAGKDRKATDVALKWVGSNPAITSAVVGIRTPQQLKEAIEAADAAPLAKEQSEALANALPANSYEQHR